MKTDFGIPPGKRRSFAQVAAAAVAADRAAIVAYADRHCRDIDGLIARGRVTAAEATMLKRRLTAFAEGVGQGLHA